MSVAAQQAPGKRKARRFPLLEGLRPLDTKRIPWRSWPASPWPRSRSPR